MKYESSAEIVAPAATVWAVYRDVAHWSDWTASVQSAVALDGPEIAVGNQFAIKQPRFPKVVWEVTTVDPGRSWTWESRALGTMTTAWHEVTALDEGRTRASQGIEQRGWLAPVLGALTSRVTKRYLAMEAAGLKARCEQAHANDPAA